MTEEEDDQSREKFRGRKGAWREQSSSSREKVHGEKRSMTTCFPSQRALRSSPKQISWPGFPMVLLVT